MQAVVELKPKQESVKGKTIDFPRISVYLSYKMNLV